MESNNPLNATVTDENVETGIKNKDVSELIEHLSNALADTYLLYTQTQGVHWNVVGPAFYSVHNLTEDQYEDLAEAIDDIAERIRALGQIAPSSYGQFEKRSIIDSKPQTDAANKMLESLIENNERVALRLRKAVNAAEDVNDVFTADMLTARIGVHEQAAWMLRALNA